VVRWATLARTLQKENHSPSNDHVFDVIFANSCLMSKRIQFNTGALISVFIGMVAAFPRVVRSDDPVQVLRNFIYPFVLSLLFWCIHRLLITSREWARYPNLRWLMVLVNVTGSIILAVAFHYVVNPYLSAGIVLQDINSTGQKIALLSFRATILSSFVMFIAYYINILSETQKARIENERLKKENLQARLNSLKEQISPHFLFNALNTLNTLTKESHVKDFIQQFSNVYRYLLTYKESDVIAVTDELRFVHSYLYILKERFEDALRISITVPDDVMVTTVPPLAIQTLIENALKHNIVSSSKPLMIHIFADERYLVVKNNYQPRQSIETGGLGLANLRERYRLLANQEILIERSHNSFTVKLPVMR
jgi:two-component system, LytTR family, sensor kinase